jgi:hypothetical protein
MFRTLSLPPAAFGVRGFTVRGRSLVSLVVKASGEFDPFTGVVTLHPAAQLVTEEVHRAGGALTSLVHGSDVALVVPRPEVLIVGQAVSRREGVTTLDVTLTVSRAGRPMLQKALRIESSKPFDRYPLLYERSLGGMTSRVNPVGRGMDPGSAPPELLYASSSAPKDLPIGLGPIPGIWPIRQQYRGSFSYYDATSKPWLDLPEGFDERYYQQAPRDQQVDSLAADDLVTITGVHAQLEAVRVAVPHLHGVAFVDVDPASAATRLDLRLDTLFINVETFEVELLWRGIFPVARSSAEQLALAGGVEQLGARLDPPDLRRANQLTAAPTKRAALTTRGTEIIEPERPAEVPSAAAPAKHSGTMVLEPDDPPPDEPPRQPTKLIFEEAAPVSLPFAKRGGDGPKRKRTPPPGSPWARPDDGPAPAPVRVEPNLASTLLVAPPEAPTAPPEPAAAPPIPVPEPQAAPPRAEPESPEPSKASSKKKSVWREDPPASPVVPPPPAPAAQKADVSKLIYKKLKR